VDLHWHRRDLRLADNRGLSVGPDDDPVLGIFVVDDGIHRYASPPRVAFVLEALSALRTAYRRRGGELVVREGDPAEILPNLASRVDARTVTAAADYSGLARRRDSRVAAGLAARDVTLETVHDAVLVPPGEFTTTAGEPYSVFTYYGRKWQDRSHPPPAPEPASEALVSPATLEGLEPGPIPHLHELGYNEPEADLPRGGPGAARRRLRAFCDDSIYEYADRRDYPAAEATSRLSPHLRFGTVGVRTVYSATEDALEAAPDAAARESVQEFRRQLAWRDFYAEHLWNHPSMVRSNLVEFEDSIEWSGDEAAYEAWTAGETGYPIVDAGMRQLRAEAWMHNRVRMVVASFLTKHLRVDWRWGYEWFREKLVDHDPANDAGGWQWAASTGTDAQPFFRVFNPSSQAETYDPDGEYVREYVPELRDVPTDAIHAWPSLDADERSELAPSYPRPIVDHDTAREAALAMFREARGEDDDGEP
jgi:deoxyribodipyrimidine photo-lyase